MEYHYELNFDTRLKMTTFCHEWQSVCWFMLKIYAVLKFLIFDRPTFWLLTFSVVLMATAISLYRAYKKSKKNLAEANEDNAMARDLSVLDEQLANVFNEIYKQSSSAERLEDTAPPEMLYSDTELIQPKTDELENEQNETLEEKVSSPKPKVLQRGTTRILRLRSVAPPAVMTLSVHEEAEFLQLSKKRPKVVHSWEAMQSQANDFEKNVTTPKKTDSEELQLLYSNAELHMDKTTDSDNVPMDLTAEESELFKQGTEIMRNHSPSPPPMPAPDITGPRRRRYAHIRPKVDTNMWKH